jgi:hypothetical protein
MSPLLYGRLNYVFGHSLTLLIEAIACTGCHCYCWAILSPQLSSGAFEMLRVLVAWVRSEEKGWNGCIHLIRSLTWLDLVERVIYIACLRSVILKLVSSATCAEWF